MMPRIVTSGFAREDLAADGDGRFGFAWLRAGRPPALKDFAKVQVSLAEKRVSKPSWCLLEGEVVAIIDERRIELMVERGGDPDIPAALGKGRFKAVLRRDDTLENPWVLESLTAEPAALRRR